MSRPPKNQWLPLVSILFTPLKDFTRAEKRDKQGLFEHLSQVIAASFDPSDYAVELIDKDYKESSSRVEEYLVKEAASTQLFDMELPPIILLNASSNSSRNNPEKRLFSHTNLLYGANCKIFWET